jgi:RNA 2',3'-cyclic 3'-phosphodiesterase
MENQTHYFFAVKIPEETKIIMKTHLEKFKINIAFNRWVHHEDLHITLAFLGFAPSENLDKAEKNVEEAIRGLKPFQLQIDRLGIFGKEDAPRVFWADTSESNKLQLLRRKVFMGCEQAGFQLETRAFRPHITLARKWVGNEPFQKELLKVWEEYQPEPLGFEAREVVLYQTQLQKEPKYVEKAVFSLD